MKLAIWMNMPSHHQSAFFASLRAAGIDLRVNYYSRVSRQRREQGWDAVTDLPAGEQFVDADIATIDGMSDWAERVHTVPGYSSGFTRKLAVELSRRRVPWMHWSEPSRPGARWLATYPLKAWYARLVNKSALAALAIGDTACRDFEHWGIDATKIELLPYSGMLPSAGPADATVAEFARDAAPLFMQIGALCQRKGIDVLLEAFAWVAGRWPGAKLALIGNDEAHGRYQAQAKRLGIDSLVLFRGPLPFATLGGTLEIADVAVLASRFDGWGMVIPEAAGYGKAIIATDACGATAHLVHDSVNGYRVDARSVESLAEAMDRYARDPALAVTHGARSPTRYADFTPERNATRFLEILHRRAG